MHLSALMAFMHRNMVCVHTFSHHIRTHFRLCTSRKTKVHYHVHKSPPLIPILSPVNAIHKISLYYFRVDLISILPLHLGLLSGLLPLGFLTKNVYAFLVSHMFYMPLYISFFSAPYFKTPSICVLPSGWDTRLTGCVAYCHMVRYNNTDHQHYYQTQMYPWSNVPCDVWHSEGVQWFFLFIHSLTSVYANG
jgi:hypothetical protein